MHLPLLRSDGLCGAMTCTQEFHLRKTPLAFPHSAINVWLNVWLHLWLQCGYRVATPTDCQASHKSWKLENSTSTVDSKESQPRLGKIQRCREGLALSSKVAAIAEISVVAGLLGSQMCGYSVAKQWLQPLNASATEAASIPPKTAIRATSIHEEGSSRAAEISG